MNPSPQKSVSTENTSWGFFWTRWPLMWVMMLVLLISNVVPIKSWAATIRGTKFIDSQSSGTQNQFDPGIDSPLPDQVIYLKSEASPAFVLPKAKLTDADGKYVFEGLSPGKYRVWQKVNPRSNEWTTYDNAHRITIDNSNDDISRDFPIPDLTPAERDFIDQQVDRANNICNTARPITDFTQVTSPNDKVKILPGVEIVVPPPSFYGGVGVRVKALCNYGTLHSEPGEDLKINATELIANYGSVTNTDDGRIISNSK